MSPITTTVPRTETKSSIHQSTSVGYRVYQPLNPHLIFHFDIIRNTKTLHFEIKLSQAPSLDRKYTKTMRGYTGIMSSTDCSCDLNGNGEKVHIQAKHCLWEPKNTGEAKAEPLWHLRVTVLKDQEARADAPGRRFVRQLLFIMCLSAFKLLILVAAIQIKASSHPCHQSTGGSFRRRFRHAEVWRRNARCYGG
jgi:hypothetical protein